MSAIALAEILAREDVWRGDSLGHTGLPAVSSGFPSLDAELPGGGWARGTLTEILSDGAGLGECMLLLPALGRLQKEGRCALLVAPPYALHAPAWGAAGIDLSRLLVVSPGSVRDALWATEQALGCGALGMVLYWTARIDSRHVRRLQVAAASSASMAFLFRPSEVRNEASLAALRLAVLARSHGRLGVDLLKRRGAPCSRTLDIDLPRPARWHEEHETRTSVACPSPAVSGDRSRRVFTLV